MERWSHYLLPKSITLSLWWRLEEAKVKIPLLVPWGWIYNKCGVSLPSLWLLDYSHDYLTSLWLFNSYMTLYILYMSSGLPLYNTFQIIIYIIQKMIMMTHDMTWHDTTWHWWHGLHDDMAMSSHSLLFLSLCLLEDRKWSLLPPPYG